MALGFLAIKVFQGEKQLVAGTRSWNGWTGDLKSALIYTARCIFSFWVQIKMEWEIAIHDGRGQLMLETFGVQTRKREKQKQ